MALMELLSALINAKRTFLNRALTHLDALQLEPATHKAVRKIILDLANDFVRSILRRAGIQED